MKEILSTICVEKNHRSICDATYSATLEMTSNITVSQFIEEIEAGHGYGNWGSIYIVENAKHSKYVGVIKYKGDG